MPNSAKHLEESPPHIPPYPDATNLNATIEHDVHHPLYVTAKLSPTSKHWTQSKTMWFNIAIALIGAVSTVLPDFQPYISPQTFSILTTVIALANMLLRGLTRDAIR